MPETKNHNQHPQVVPHWPPPPKALVYFFLGLFPRFLLKFSVLHPTVKSLATLFAASGITKQHANAATESSLQFQCYLLITLCRRGSGFLSLPPVIYPTTCLAYFD